jgi:hypothetical protein
VRACVCVSSCARVCTLSQEGRYESGAVGTPLVLQWKDAGCSKYPVDTAADGSPLPYQVREEKSDAGRVDYKGNQVTSVV